MRKCLPNGTVGLAYDILYFIVIDDFAHAGIRHREHGCREIQFQIVIRRVAVDTLRTGFVDKFRKPLREFIGMDELSFLFIGFSAPCPLYFS